ncbi:cytochrome c oxidase accessory protein CcoG [Owenweeksia hongkongensis]|uniref:cytochrome c oxidase accessory protein CcoG n=1 Tax=Owenweeksia hongkongensis TaxID=253245 RepID=UPI003A8D79BB
MGVHIPNPNFRDHIGTIDESGKRKFLYPRKTNGKFTNYRRIASYILLAILIFTPFIQIDGEPFMMFNIIERKFILFGKIFWPEDFLLALVAMLIGVLFIAVFTVAFGRLFCGWICPQTIFMEHVFRRIEYWIDGDRNQQMRLAKMKWNAEKIRKRVFKNGIFFAISFGISNIFLMYIIGRDAWWEIVSDNPVNHIAGLASMLIFTGVFFFVFAWFREQVCIIVCPYGRLQSVLLDRNSIVIAYDYVRGEIRSKFKKSEDREAVGKGDCIDCNQCVEVCPTGIDIRNGTQLECINCTACMDACDHVMDKIDRPRGLIRYDSENNIANNTKKILTTRVIGYLGVLVILTGLFGFLLAGRTAVDTLILRTPGQLYQKVSADTLSNLYNYKMVNKTAEDMELEVKLLEPKGRLQLIGANPIELGKGDLSEGAMIIFLAKDDLESNNTDLKIGIFKQGVMIDEVETSFNGPIVRR